MKYSPPPRRDGAREVLCAYCSTWVLISDLPDRVVAECWDCLSRRYEPPRLPWWRVSAW